ncbi:Phosphate metabolism transcription protein [Savitreella phatthalungensis]
MRFGQTLRDSQRKDWPYLTYDDLKVLLKQDKPAEEWTEDDESRFVERLDENLEKVYSFQAEHYDKLVGDVTRLENELDSIQSAASHSADEKQVKSFIQGLDNLTEESKELEKYSRVNYTGFVKIVKKHDKLHTKYTVRPLLNVRMQACTFNKENYSPLLFRLSALYAGVRELAEEDANLAKSVGTIDGSNSQAVGDAASAPAVYRFWVHPDNYMEVKTFILRRLPVLVFTDNDKQDVDAQGYHDDPTITQLYFDSKFFKLYLDKLEHKPEAKSIFVQWYGNLKSQAQLFVHRETSTGEDDSEVQADSFPIKEKYVQGFFAGEPVMDKQFKKQHDPESFSRVVKSIQADALQNRLEPILRATYTRTAFQIPGDDAVKVTLDTNVALIREDALDTDRPCRDPETWHRRDIDEQGQEYPYKSINKGEINRLPFGLLEIKIKRRPGFVEPSWIEDLSSSHLVKAAPRFSKYAHGVATLFENHVNLLPFWLPDADKDIRIDPTSSEGQSDDKSYPPKMVFTPRSLESKALIEAARNARHNAGDLKRRGESIDAGSSSGKSKNKEKSKTKVTLVADTMDEGKTANYGATRDGDLLVGASRMSSLKRVRSMHQVLTGHTMHTDTFDISQLPPGVKKPGKLIKDSGPNKVEAKVWLANERTFIKWMHVGVLLATVALGLYNAARTPAARAVGAIYAVIAVGMAGWGYYVYQRRARMIRDRSPEHFDAFSGPILLCLAMMISLLINFFWRYQELSNTHPHLVPNIIRPYVAGSH